MRALTLGSKMPGRPKNKVRSLLGVRFHGLLSPRLKLNFINFTKTRESLLTANGRTTASAP